MKLDTYPENCELHPDYGLELWFSGNRIERVWGVSSLRPSASRREAPAFYCRIQWDPTRDHSIRSDLWISPHSLRFENGISLEDSFSMQRLFGWKRVGNLWRRLNDIERLALEAPGVMTSVNGDR